MLQYFIALFVKPISLFIPVRRKHWVFGANSGRTYREGSKYLLEYMLENHPEYDCTFITKDINVYEELKRRNIPCEMNYSIRGIMKVCVADCVFTCQTLADINFAYPKFGRSYYYMGHGQPFKKAMGMLNQSFFNGVKKRSGLRARFLGQKDKLAISLAVGYGYKQVDFVTATSDVTASFLRMEYPIDVDVKILGMPRNDALFQPDRMKKERWLDSLKGKFIITYMPTHRKYGKGKISPIPFVNNENVQQWMRKNNIVLLIKQHPNMVPLIRDVFTNDVIIDISKEKIDPQVIIYHSDVLITDYSSVWMDYLLLKKPLIFYFYDNFEVEDAGCYYNLRDEFPKNYCESEEGLFEKLMQAKVTPSILIPAESVIHKYHIHVDGLSSQRYFEYISSKKYCQ